MGDVWRCQVAKFTVCPAGGWERSNLGQCLERLSAPRWEVSAGTPDASCLAFKCWELGGDAGEACETGTHLAVKCLFSEQVYSFKTRDFKLYLLHISALSSFGVCVFLCWKTPRRFFVLQDRQIALGCALLGCCHGEYFSQGKS